MGKRLIAVMLLLTVAYILPGFTVEAKEPINFHEVEKYIQENMDKHNVPGMSYVFITTDEIKQLAGYGLLEKGGEVEVDADTIFGIASVSKNMTSVAILQLEEKGLLNVSDPVVKHLPWFGTKDTENSEKITIAHLMQHISGIPTTAYGLELKDGTEDDLEAQVKELSKMELTATPGSTFQYSNLNFWTQALLVEKLTGMKFADYMQENVFKPLKMDRTGYYRQIKDLDNVALGHRYEGGESKLFDYHVPAPTDAAGGVYTSAVDMTAYLYAIFTGNHMGRSILSQESIDKMLYTGLDSEFHYSYGWFAEKWEGETIIYHGGDNPNYTADLYLLPDEGVAFALMSNSQNMLTHVLAQNIADHILLDRELAPIEVSPSAAGYQMAQTIAYASYGLFLIAILWLVFAIRGIQKGKYRLMKTLPGKVRTVLQVVLVPLMGLAIAFFGYQLPVQMIGSYHIALLYQPDLVKNLLGLITALVFFTLLVGFMAFVRKPNSDSLDL